MHDDLDEMKQERFIMNAEKWAAVGLVIFALGLVFIKEIVEWYAALIPVIGW